jgi:hypothetical protein
MTTQTNLPTNEKVILKKRPESIPQPDEFDVVSETARAPDEGEVLVKTEAISIDAWIRTTLSPGWLHEIMPVGETVGAMGVGRVVESQSPDLKAGDAVAGAMGAQTYATIPGAMLQKVDDSQVPLTAYIGGLGITTGLTAYFGIRAVGQVKKGETVLVSAAAGAVGSIAGQIAKIDGARVIGTAGGPDKVKFLVEDLGFDAAIDYKNDDIAKRLKELAPDGIDVFFDNVGGELLDIALDNIRERGRIAICGAISQYDDHENVYGPKLYLRLAERYARMEGFTVMHFMDQFPEAFENLTKWLVSGELKMHEHVVEGIGSFPKALNMLFTGGNTGKLIVRP